MPCQVRLHWVVAGLTLRHASATPAENMAQVTQLFKYKNSGYSLDSM